MATNLPVAAASARLPRIPRGMSLSALVRRRHCGGLSHAELGEIGLMQHVILVRYEGIRRQSGAPATDHFFAVQDVLVTLNFGVVAELIGLGHDLVEDGVMTADEITETVGPKVASGILVLSKGPEYKGNPSAYSDQILEAVMRGFWEPGVAKLADRGHNLRTLDGFKDPGREAAYLAGTEKYILPLAEAARAWVALYAPAKLASYDVLCAMLYDEYRVQCRRLVV